MDLEALKSITEYSNYINDLAFKLVVATLAIILTTSYVKPVAKKWKIIYLVFIPGWLFLYFSISNNVKLNRSALMAQVIYNDIDSFKKYNKIDSVAISDTVSVINKKVTNLNQTFVEVNSSFSRQLNFFKCSLIAFAIWLLAYLFWWIFFDKLIQNENKH